MSVKTIRISAIINFSTVGESKKSSFTKNASGEEEGRNEGGGRKEGMKGEEGRKGGRRVRMEGIYDRKGCKEGSDMR